VDTVQKILVVSDHAANLLALETTLNQTDAELIKASSGQEALVAALHDDFAVAILDIQIPEDGFVLAEFLRGDQKTHSLPIIFFTAVFSNDENIRLGNDLGAVDYIVKPYDPKVLISKVKVFLELNSHKQSLEIAMGEAQRHSLVMANKEIANQYEQKKKRADELVIANKELIIAKKEKEKREAELAIAKEEKEKQADELLIANKELAFQNEALKKSASDLKAVTMVIEKEREQLAQRVNERTVALRDINEQLERAKLAAEDANRAKSVFLAAMSHEIRTPMNGVVGMAEVLSHSEMTADQADAVKTIRDSAFLLLRLIDDILDFSKIEAGKLELEHAQVSVSDVVEIIYSSLKPVAANKGVELSVFVDPRVPAKIWSDSIRLQQVLFNLIGNAIKFSDRDRDGDADGPGQVSVRVEIEYVEPRRLNFMISDNGIGMTDETMSNLFTLFHQAETSTTRRFGGTGLGLAITHRIVQLMHGNIAVESVPDAGSQFIVTLPLEIVENYEHRALRDLSGLNCIMVSGANNNMKGLLSYLQYAGANTYLVDNLADASRQACELSKPIVISTENKNNITGSINELHNIFPMQIDLTHVLITYGQLQHAHMAAPNVLAVGGNTSRIDLLLRAIAAAASEASLEIFYGEMEAESIQDMPTAPILTTIAEARAAGRLILVAEDDDINQKVILRQLALLGFRADMARDGQEALNLWRKGGYALLLCDLHMPELDGYELTKIIRREETTGQHISILALTANALRGEIHRAIEAGMDEYMTKPMQLKDLASNLKKWMPAEVESGSLPTVNMSDATSTNMIVDLNVLKGLVGDDPEILQELLGDYLISARKLASELRDAFYAGNSKHLGYTAHKLKSSSRSLGAIIFGDLCADLENDIRAENRKSLETHMSQFDSIFEKVDRSVSSMLKE
jgi:signal transduction histidine kinase/ActR/RegA family two-component response regulator/HPt (histidine-containing phosphotransfer) domain-containing protein